jgi:nitroreductase/NAD-dependent dihydropyrimidine dehydrogenase PreA subunit
MLSTSPPLPLKKMQKVVLDKYVCVRCGQCIVSCPAYIYRRESSSEHPEVSKNANENCIGCNHCVAACPVNAITVNGVDGKMCLDFIQDAKPRFDHIASLVRVRRSIRSYAPQPLETRIIEQLLDTVRWAPTSRNLLPVKWIVLNEKEKMRDLTALVIKWIGTQPGGDAIESAWKKGIDPIFRGAPCLIIAYTGPDAQWADIDTSIAVGTLDLCAAAMRLGSCWAGYFIRAAQNEPSINQFLGLKEDETVHGGLMLGHIGEEAYRRIPYRPELNVKWL